MNSDMCVASYPRSGRRIFTTTLRLILKNPEDSERIVPNHKVNKEQVETGIRLLRHPIPTAISHWEYKFHNEERPGETYDECNRDEFFQFVNQGVQRWRWHYINSAHGLRFKAEVRYQDLIFDPISVYRKVSDLYDIEFLSEAEQIIRERYSKQAYGGKADYKPRNLLACPFYSRRDFTQMWLDTDAFFQEHNIILMNI